MTRSALLSLVLAPSIAFAGGLELGAEDGLGEGRDVPEPVDPQVGGPEAAPIINGVDALLTDYPMTGATVMDAYLQIPSLDSGDIRTMVCSSTLIAPDVVLLAAHCVDEEAFTYGFGTMSDIDIRWTRQVDLSAHDGSTIAPWPEDAIVAWDWVKHPSFDLMSMDIGLAENFDIALLFLDTPVLDTEPAYLITPEEVDQIAQGTSVEIVGWGQQTATSMWEPPPAGTYAIKQMGTSFLNEVSPYEFQVGAVQTDVRKCHGDSGGPTFMDVETETYAETMRIIGVTSHSYDNTDCNEKGGVDTRIDHYREWIDSEMAARCTDGTRAWCDEENLGILPPPLPEQAKACGCSAAGGGAEGAGWLVGVLGLLLARRRR